MPKKRKGASKKGPSPEGVVASATTRRPEEGSREENELGQLPGPLPRVLAGNPGEGYPSQGPGWERRSQKILESFVRSGQLPESVLLPTPAPAFTDKVCEVGSPPIGGPGWEHDIIPPTVRIPDHICMMQDPLCTFPQRGNHPVPCPTGGGVHACRPQDPWCQSGHRGRCPHNTDRIHQMPIFDCWCPECQLERGYRCTKEWTGPCILPSRQQLSDHDSDSTETGSTDSLSSSEDTPSPPRKDRTARMQTGSKHYVNYRDSPDHTRTNLPLGVTDANIAGPSPPGKGTARMHVCDSMNHWLRSPRLRLPPK